MKFQTKLRPALFSILFSTLFISLYAQKSSNFSIDLSTNFIQDLGFDSFKDHLLDQPSLRLNWTNPKFSLGAEVGIIKDRVTTLFDEYPRIMGAVADLDVNSDSWKHTYLILGPSLNLINNRWLQLGIGVKAGFNFLQESPDLIIRDKFDADRVYQQYLPAAEKKMEFLFKPALELQVFP
ncbi:MAG: hypothetical protein KJP00_13480, partial [Bacteroidia bacterium]|nr:hypothetical protein [Bacteroidia bacterium]